MDAFRFILENPHPAATQNKQRKRARLVTACDSCRVKKIKCQQSSPDARCEACKSSKTPCLFGDRDRYQAERGVTCTWTPPPLEDTPASSPEPYSRKRKIASPPTDQWPSRSASPSNSRFMHNDLHAGPSSLVRQLDVFPLPPSALSLSPSYVSLPLFDPARPQYPHPQRMHHLGTLFFDSVASNFPFLDRYDILHRIEHRTCSAILSNCIAGLAARFSDPDSQDFAASATFYEMAKSLATHVASAPSVEALHALLCIAWAEHTSGHQSAFSTYARMAITMCLDLGLGNEATIQVARSPEVRLRLRLTWWFVVSISDMATSWETGQPTALDLDSFDTAPPQPTDTGNLERGDAALREDPQPAGMSALDLFTAPQNVSWLLRPALTDDTSSTASDTSSSLRSSSRELSPHLASTKSVPPSVGASPLVRGVDEAPSATDMSFRSSDIFETVFDGEIFDMQQLFDEPCGLPFELDGERGRLDPKRYH